MKYIILILCLFVGSINLYAKEKLAPPIKTVDRIFNIAHKNINIKGPFSQDSLIALCYLFLPEYEAKKEDNTRFKIDQILINSYSLKGDLGLAITHTRKMYTDATASKNKLGIALALQSIATTYLHSNQLEKALTAFDEAKVKLLDIGDNECLIKLYTQQMHTYFLLNDTASLKKLILKSEQLLKNNPNIVSDYLFYTLSYKSLYFIATNQPHKAKEILDKIEKWEYNQNLFYRWYYTILSRYYILIEKDDVALDIINKILGNMGEDETNSEFRNVLYDKANLLEKMKLEDEACKTYESIKTLTDTIDNKRYTRQIETLHIAYQAEQMKIDNIKSYNQLLIYSIICAIGILLSILFLILYIQRKNRILEKSRDELRIIKENAESSIKSKSIFLSNMSHDLRTPLNAIVGFSELLTNPNNDLDNESKILCNQHIQQSADLLMKLFNDIVDLSALNENKINFTFAQHDIISLCNGVIKTIETVKKTEAELIFSSSTEQLSFITDHIRLQQVLINLLVNATKFTKQGEIRLLLEIDNDKEVAIFTIEDTGCGIPLEQQKRIFERFEKLNKDAQGVGLGLSICKLIIDRFQGEITIDASYTQGARFIFTHPLNCLQ